MSGININNTEDEASYDDKTIMGLKDLKDKITVDNTVSKNDVLSTEEFIGVGIITNKYNSNKYTNMPTSIMADETVEYIDSILDKHGVDEATYYTKENLYDKLNELTRYINSILINIENVDSDGVLYNAIKDRTVFNIWDADNLVNLLDGSLVEIFNKEYLLSTIFNNVVSDDEINVIKGDINTFPLLDLLMMLTDKETGSTYFYLNDMLKRVIINNHTGKSLEFIYDNKIGIVEILKNLIKFLIKDYKRNIINDFYIENKLDIKREYTILSKLTDIFKDEDTKLIVKYMRYKETTMTE